MQRLYLLSLLISLKHLGKAGSSCDEHTVPYQVVINDEGDPEMFCTEPICDSLQKNEHHTAEKQSLDTQLTARLKTNTVTKCGKWKLAACSEASEWTSDLHRTNNGSDSLLYAKCCSFAGLPGASVLPSMALNAGERYRGGAVYENGHFTAFDLVKEVTRSVSAANGTTYHLELRRLSCTAFSEQEIPSDLSSGAVKKRKNTSLKSKRKSKKGTQIQHSAYRDIFSRNYTLNPHSLASINLHGKVTVTLSTSTMHPTLMTITHFPKTIKTTPTTTSTTTMVTTTATHSTTAPTATTTPTVFATTSANITIVSNESSTTPLPVAALAVLPTTTTIAITGSTVMGNSSMASRIITRKRKMFSLALTSTTTVPTTTTVEDFFPIDQRLNDEPRKRKWRMPLYADYYEDEDEYDYEPIIRRKPQRHRRIRYLGPIRALRARQRLRHLSAARSQFPPTEYNEDVDLAALAKTAIPPPSLVTMATPPRTPYVTILPPFVPSPIHPMLNGLHHFPFPQASPLAFGTGSFALPPNPNQRFYQNQPQEGFGQRPGDRVNSLLQQQQQGLLPNDPNQPQFPQDLNQAPGQLPQEPNQAPFQPQQQALQPFQSGPPARVEDAAVVAQPPLYTSYVAPAVPASMQCFSGDMLVQTPSGQKTMRDLQVGDKVLSVEDNFVTYTPVIMFLHRLPEESTTFLELQMADSSTLKLTSEHLIYARDCVGNENLKLVHAREAQIGQCLYRATEDLGFTRFVATKIIDIRLVLDNGIYAPLTATGDLVVNGIMSSCHSNFALKTLQQTFFDVTRTIHRRLASWPTLARQAVSNADLPFGVSAVAQVFDLLIPSSVFE